MKQKNKKSQSLTAVPPLKMNDPEVLKLWVRAGGRCEFDGCNKYLLEDEFTGFPVSIADVAHIIGRKKSPRSPRGEDSLSIEERNKAENLILLCSEHHNKIVDKKELLSEFPKEVLLKYKRVHEERIRYVTGLGPERETAVICMVGNIRGHAVSISREEIRKAVWESNGRYPRYFASENNIKIDLTGLPEKDEEIYWESGREIIDDAIERKIFAAIKREKINHLSILALARIPFLVYLGHCLGDKVVADIYQKHRDEDEGWIWRKGGETVQFKSNLLQKGEKNSKVALILSISGKITLEQLPNHINNDFNIYEIEPEEGIKPNRSIVTLESTLGAFRSVYQKLLREIERLHSNAKEIQLFPAIPISVAIICGRELMKTVSPSLCVYDKTTGGYNFTMDVN